MRKEFAAQKIVKHAQFVEQYSQDQKLKRK